MGRFLSQRNTEASISPMMELLNEKKKKKKMKKKADEAEETEQKSTSILEAVGLSPRKKKKKKKKENFELETENFNVVTHEMQTEFTVGESSLENITKVKKKKKKKKKQKIEANNNEELTAQISSSKHPQKDLTDSLSESPKKRALMDETEYSPRKKKRKKSSEQASHEVQESFEEVCKKVADEDKVGDYIWSVEEELMILERMKNQLPENDKKSCRITLKKIDWESVAFSDRSGEACKNHFKRILSKINVIKSLTTVLEEAKDFAETWSKRRRRVLQPKQRFLKVYMDSNRKEIIKANGENYFSVAHEAWENLPKEMKAAYQAEYDEDLRKLGLMGASQYKDRTKRAAKKNTPISLPRSPYEIWSMEESERTNNQNTYEGKKVNSRMVFSNMLMQKKMQYIILSLRELLIFQKEAEEFMKHNPNYKFPKYLGPGKEELKFYLEEKGMPACPPSKPYVLFYREKVESGEIEEVKGKNKLVKAMLMFRNLSYSEKEMYKYSLNEKLAAYYEEMTAWEKEQDEITLFARERHLGKKMQHLGNIVDSGKSHTPKNKKIKKVCTPRHKSQKVSEVFSNVVKFDMSCPKFHDEPIKAPSTPFKLFSMRLEHSLQRKFESNAQKNKVCREYWEKLSDQQRFAYAKRCSELRKKYEEQVLQYVQNMSKKMRKVYLGFHRKTLFNYFHHDIFEEIYPNIKYPVYVSSPKKKRAEGEESEEDFVDAPTSSIVNDIETTSKPPKNADNAKRKKTHTSLQLNDELSKSGKSDNISESKSAKNVTAKAHVSVSYLSGSGDECIDAEERKSFLASPMGKTAIESLGRGERHLESSEEDEKTRINYKKKHDLSEEESSGDSDDESHSKLSSKGFRTVQGSTLKKGKLSPTTPMKCEFGGSSDDETDIEVRPAWQTQVDIPTRKPVDDSSSGFSDSD